MFDRRKDIDRDALVVVEDPNDIFYLTGEKVSRGTLYLHADEAFLLVDQRYFEGCQKNTKVTTFLTNDENEKKAINSYPFSTVILSGNKLTFDRYTRLQGLFLGKKITNGDPIRLFRFVKGKDEVAKMKKSALLNKEAMEKIERELKEGVTEEEVAWSFEKYSREKGASGMAFLPHIAFGKNTSKPHYRSGKTKLKKGDAVLIDTGVILDSYVSDRTRSFLFEGENREYEKMHALVLEAHNRALEKVSIGTPLKVLAETVQEFFREKKVEKLFKHNLGHSLGLEVHEYPTLSVTLAGDLVCKEGMVFTIEPGLYIDGHFGIRHENTVVVTKAGGEIL